MRSPMNKAYIVTSKYGIRNLTGKPEMHNGIDLVPQDRQHPTDLFATVDGTVEDMRTTVPDNHTGLKVTTLVTGNYVNIRTKSGWLVIYRHLKYGSIPVNIVKGANVKISDKIGVMGTTGQSSGVHLHYEIRDRNGVSFDPLPYVGTSKTLGETEVAKPVQTSAFSVGDRVRVKSGTRTYDGGGLASFVYVNIYTVMQVNGDRVVIGQNGAVTAAINAADLLKD